MRQRLGVHAVAGVAYGEHHVRSGPGVRSLSKVGLVELNVTGLDDQLAALGHGVAGVDRQVHDHLLHLAGVGLDRA